MGKRLLTTAITIPTLFIIIFLLPHYSFLALSLLVVLVATYGAKELKRLYEKAEGTTLHLSPWAIGLIPLAQWFEIAYASNFPLVDLTVVLLALFFFSTELRHGNKDEFSKSLSRIGGESLLIFYPGILITFIQRITTLPNPSASLTLFFLLVFGNDVFAFIFGMSLGRKNKGIMKASPNKSLAGFIGGILSTVILAVLYCLFVPGIKENISIVMAVVLGLATSSAATIGDLIESAFKRSAAVKDSGTLIPGRGGLLDSIDSMLASAPIYWLLLTLLF
jgi:phosphatidate cytidylyltransferase